MATSQTAQFGEILTNEQVYSKDISEISTLSAQQEQVLLDRALNNDAQAKEEMILSCLPYVKNVARSYAHNYKSAAPRVDFLELVQVGNLALVESIEPALLHDRPFAFLRVRAKYAIIRYCMCWSSLVYRSEKGPFVPVESLDAPLDATAPELTLANLLTTEDIQELPLSFPPEVFDKLRLTLDMLTERHRKHLSLFFGLGDCDTSILADLREDRARYKVAQTACYKALDRLKQLYECSLDDLASEVYSTAEVRELLGVGKRMTERIIVQHAIKPVRYGFYLKQDIDALVQQRRMRKAS